MKKSEFLALVQEELDTIKVNATKKEINRLNFSGFIHHSSYSCIYGQMTGKCNSVRAKEIFPKKYDAIGGGYCDGYRPFKTQDYDHGFSFTPLEKYLYMVKAPQHKKLIQYLKGERKTIKL